MDQVAAGWREFPCKHCLPNLAKCWTDFHGFAHNSLVSCPFLTCKVRNRSFGYPPYIGQRVVSSILFLVWSTAWSNLGQTWSTLVKLGQSSPNSGKCIPDHILRASGHSGVLVGLETARSNLGQTSVNLGQTWSTLVKLGQTLGNVSRTFFRGAFDVARLRRVMLARPGLSRFTCRHPRKSRG